MRKKVFVIYVVLKKGRLEKLSNYNLVFYYTSSYFLEEKLHICYLFVTLQPMQELKISLTYYIIMTYGVPSQLVLQLGE